MSYQAGSAISYYILDITDAERKAAQLRSVYQGIRQDAASLSTPVVAQNTTSTTTGLHEQAAALQHVAQATGIYASATQELIAQTIELGVAQGLTTDQINAQLAALSREALAAGDLIAANELIDASLGQQVVLLKEDTVVTVENTRVKQENATVTKGVSDKNSALEAGMKSLFSPLAVFTASVAGAVVILKSFDDALNNQGVINEERQAFGGIIGDFNQGNVIIDQATRSTREYGITAKDTTEAFKTLAPIIRESTSTVDAQAGALERISTLNPANPVQALTSAIEGIQSGRILGLRRELGLSTEQAKALVDSVKDGKDVFIALNEVLDTNGITLGVARERMQGYEGATRQAALAQEDLEKAQAKFALGPGLQLKHAEIDALNNVTQVLSGNTQLLITDMGNLANALNPVNTITNVVSKSNEYAINTFNQLAGTAIPNTTLSINGATEALNNFLGLTNQLAPASDASAQALQREADADDRYTASTYKAVVATDALTHAQYEQNKQELANQRAGERSGGLFDTVEQTTTAYDRQHEASAQAAQDAANLRDAQLGYAHATDDTATQRRILNQELKNATGDPAKELEIRTQLIQLDKEHNSHKISAAQSTALQLNNLAENSGEQQLKIERENLERLRDQQEEFDLRRTRSKEDEERKILGLLARGQRAAAAREREDFAISQKRAQEDYDIARQKTLRNNTEAANDLNNRTDLRTSQITDRAALKGINIPSVGTTGGTVLPPLAAPQRASATREIAQITLQGTVNLDNKQVGTQLWPVLRVFVDDELSLSITQSNTPASGQTAVSGVTP